MATEVRANDGRGLPRYGSGVEGELLAGPVLEDCRSVQVRVQRFVCLTARTRIFTRGQAARDYRIPLRTTGAVVCIYHEVF